MTEEESYCMVEQECARVGGSIHWFPASGHACAGAPDSAHVLLGGASHEIPPYVCTSLQRFRAWLFTTMTPRSAPPSEYTQLTLDL